MVKNLSVNAGAIHKTPGFHPWVGKIPWRRKWQPIPAFLLGNPTDRGAWWATVHGVTRVRHDLVTKPPPDMQMIQI